MMIIFSVTVNAEWLENVLGNTLGSDNSVNAQRNPMIQSFPLNILTVTIVCPFISTDTRRDVTKSSQRLIAITCYKLIYT